MNLLEFLFFGAISGAVAYFLGSVSFAIIVSKFVYKKDIRNFGSGNAGMTNMLRTFGKKAATLTMTGDVLKGVIAVALGRFIFVLSSFEPVDGAYIAAFFAVLGHIYPIYFGFKGGKAVSVSTGAIVGINPLLIVPVLIVFAISFLATKMVSVGSICCAISYPIFTFLYYVYLGYLNEFALVASCLMGAIVIYLHRQNIKRILNGTEYKFMQKKKNEQK